MAQIAKVKMNQVKSLFPAFLVAVAILSGCKAGTQSVSKSIDGTTWELARLMGNAVDMKNYPDGVPTISFSAGGAISGSTGCNSFNGDYVLRGDSLSLDLGSMTKMMCDGPGEMDFIFATKEVNFMKVDETGLTLLNGSKEVLGFKAK